jgi:hypothetical protein
MGSVDSQKSNVLSAYGITTLPVPGQPHMAVTTPSKQVENSEKRNDVAQHTV